MIVHLCKTDKEKRATWEFLVQENPMLASPEWRTATTFSNVTPSLGTEFEAWS
jgi:hypothetical protein